MTNLPHCQYPPLALRAALRPGRPAGGERLIGWGPASQKPGAMSLFKQIGLALLPGIGDVAWALAGGGEERWLMLVLTDQRLLLVSTASPAVGIYPDVGPVSIGLGELEVVALDEPGAFRIGQVVADVADEVIGAPLSLMVEFKKGAESPAEKLNRGLLVLAGGATAGDDQDAEEWEPRATGWN